MKTFYSSILRACITAMLFASMGAPLHANAGGKPKFINYEQYGAVGDGVHDDMDAIVAAHAAANETGLPVRLSGGKTYYIGNAAKTAIIRTDVDFADSKFIIDDVGMDMKGIGAPIFRVDPDEAPFTVDGVTALKKGQKKLGVNLGTRCMVQVVNDRKKVYIRFGPNQDSGSGQQEVFIVNAGGKISKRSGIVWDYDHITSIKAVPIPRKTLLVKGGTFTTIANDAESKYTYYARNILVHRSNVRIEGMTHLVTGELDHGAPYSGFLYVTGAADVTISNCLLTAHKTYRTTGSAGTPVSMGSYDLGAFSSVNVLFENCTQTTDIDDRAYWGLFGSNFCKELRMDGCRISRFDAHMGVENVTLTDCTFGYMGVRAVGFGTMLIKGCEIHDTKVVSLREDYGSCWDGKMIIKDCTLKILNGGIGTVSIIDGYNPGKHDFGYLCRLPQKITVDNLVIDDAAIRNGEYDGPAIMGTFGRNVSEPGLLPYPVPETVTLKNVTTTSGKPLKVSYNEAMFADLEVSGM